MAYGDAWNMQIAEWREKARTGTLDKEEMRQIIQAMREARGKMTPATGGSRVTKAKKAAAGKPNGDDLLSELENM